ncbi:protoglobin domain-containing protein [Blastopirellula marina]|uniref:Anti-anti-sigma factor n=1 Tax=Blastopirellula marina TaxID=124 RepID=A0A2S8FLE4_9BACT|nr:protoglobin domain-containing protein [Blastopirellula marina]PQO32986.1 anti-anti-sigma factor [Blastopirellula marina]PTL43153.1 STAS domain-containing protein [Blastopirellula marina]
MNAQGDLGNLSAPELRELYHVTEEDLELLLEYSKIVLPQLDDFIEQFYDWMKTQPEYELYFSDPTTLERVQNQQRHYWQGFFAAAIDEAYVHKRKSIGASHARVGLSLPTYVSGMYRSLRIWTDVLYDHSLSPERYARSLKAITKLIMLDTAIVVDTYMRQTHYIIAEQHDSLMQMSTPVTEVWNDILMLPIVGIIDSKRAQDIMTAVLHKISDTHSRSLILDISGVAVVDTAVANHLIKITKATRLMGCTCTISGVSPAIAQTIVELGINVGDIRTTATLKDALRDAFGDMKVPLQSNGTPS